MQGSAGGGDDIVFYAGDPAGAGEGRAPRAPSVFCVPLQERTEARSPVLASIS